mmetsp:Transcript_37128/g.114662  ORF Transcript_37128/g.114662 Transcript_37128/m.114662 type:complete len:252 (+) Transcript_37128:300-1055(+)
MSTLRPSSGTCASFGCTATSAALTPAWAPQSVSTRLLTLVAKSSSFRAVPGIGLINIRMKSAVDGVSTPCRMCSCRSASFDERASRKPFGVRGDSDTVAADVSRSSLSSAAPLDAPPSSGGGAPSLSGAAAASGGGGSASSSDPLLLAPPHMTSAVMMLLRRLTSSSRRQRRRSRASLRLNHSLRMWCDERGSTSGRCTAHASTHGYSTMMRVSVAQNSRRGVVWSWPSFSSSGRRGSNCRKNSWWIFAEP